MKQLIFGFLAGLTISAVSADVVYDDLVYGPGNHKWRDVAMTVPYVEDDLHWKFLNGKQYYEFPPVESINGGDINDRYLKQAGTVENEQSYINRELAYRLSVVEKRLGVKVPHVSGEGD